MADGFTPHTRVHLDALNPGWFGGGPKLDEAQKALVAAYHDLTEEGRPW